MEAINKGLRPVYKTNDSPHLPTMISIITRTNCARIGINEIEMVEQIGRVLHLITADRDYSLYENIENIAGAFKGRCFFRPLNSIIINFDCVRDMDDSFIRFYSGKSTTLGKNAFGKTRAEFRKYLEAIPEYVYTNDSLKVAEK